MSCPVVKTIGEIYGSGMVQEDDPSSVIKVGGYEVIVDEMSFYIARRKLALARFELSKPSDAAIEKFYKAEFEQFARADAMTIFKYIFPANSHLYNKFTSLIDILGTIEDTLLTYISSRNKLNLSLPTLTLPATIDRWILFEPYALEHAVNTIVDYINAFSVDAKKPRVSIQHLRKFDKSPHGVILGKTSFEWPDEPKITLKILHEILELELKVADYARNFEKYQVEAMNLMDKIMQDCQKIIDLMLQQHISD